MKVAIIGSRSVGKTTLFVILTREEKLRNRQDIVSNVSRAILYDRRLDELESIFKPKRKTYASLEIHDFEGFGKLWKEERASEMIQHLNRYDLLLHVTTSRDDFDEINYRLLLIDLTLVERRIELLKKQGKRRELETFQKLRKYLEEEIPISSIELTQEDRMHTRGFAFATSIPRIIVYNVWEGRKEDESFMDFLRSKGIRFVHGNLLLEYEASKLEENERKQILEEFGYTSIQEKLVESIKKELGIITFFTVGEKEVRAWILKEGSNVKQAAGKIHSDLERAFVRAEVINYEEFMKVKDMKEAKRKGMVRVEGKDYIVKDGDIILIRASI